MYGDFSQPLVSVMIPTYNQPEYIAEAIDSALAQDYSNIEVIISDDSTNSDTEVVVKKFNYDSRVRYFKNTKNIGRVANYRRLLFELANGDWVLMLDGDDFIIEGGYISSCVKIVKENPSVVLVGAGIKILNGRSGELKERQLVKDDIVFNGKKVFRDLLELPNHQTDFYPRKLACELDFYRDPSMASDSESLFRLCLNGDVAYLPTIASVWRIHQHNTTYTLNIRKQIRELVFIDKVYDYSLDHLDKVTAKKWRRYMYNLMTMHIFYLEGIKLTDMLHLYLKVRGLLTPSQRKFFVGKMNKAFKLSLKYRIKSVFRYGSKLPGVVN